MARKAFASFEIAGNERSIWKSIATALATMASGKNPDATDYTLPVSAPVASPTAVATGTADAQAVVATASLRLLGYSVMESAGSPAAAALVLRHGTDAAASPLAVEKLAASGCATRWFGPNGIACPNGIFLDRTSGETTVVLHTAVIA